MQLKLTIDCKFDQATFEAYKDRIDVPEVCEEAIWREIYILRESKTTPPTLTDREKAIARWRSERGETRDLAYAQGRRYALDEAYDMAYFEFEAVGRLVSEGCNAKEVEAYFRRQCFDKFINLRWGILDEDFPKEEHAAWLEGWVAGIAEVWESVKAEVEAG